MKIEKVTASVRLSAQLPSGAWKSVEFGAEAQIGPNEHWGKAQAQLYSDLVVQLTEVWSATAKRPAGGPTAAATATPPADPVCPIHHKGVPSDHGGLWCPTKVEGNKWCPWRHAKPTTKGRSKNVPARAA